MRILLAMALLLTNFGTLSANWQNNRPACWEGFYLNGQLGAGWNKHKVRFTNNNYFNTLGATRVGSNFELDSKGFLGGGAIGYNKQCGCWVFGVEGGALGTNLKKSKPSPFFPELDTFTGRVNWLGYTKLRAGYAYNCFLPFIAGGWSGGYVDMLLYDTPSDITAHKRKWTNGWILGCGLDYKVSKCFSVGVAYDYSQLRYKNTTIGCPTCGTGAGFGTPKINNRISTQILTFRFNINL